MNISLQIDDASHYIDGSQIYGSNDYIMSTLRSFTDGTLMSIIENNQEFCPHSTIELSNSNKYFYNTGKSKNNTFIL